MADDKSKVEYIDNPNPIRKKVKVQHGVDPSELIAKADESVKKLGGEFEQIFAGNIAEIAAAMSDVNKGGMARMDGLDTLRRVLHDLRGQAGTFGYPLVSQVGDSACKFIDLTEDFEDTEIEVLTMHVDALRAIHQAKITGDGGPVGQELMSGLRKVILKYNAARTP